MIKDREYEIGVLRERAASADGKLRQLEKAKAYISELEGAILQYRFAHDFRVNLNPSRRDNFDNNQGPRGGGIC